MTKIVHTLLTFGGLAALATSEARAQQPSRPRPDGVMPGMAMGDTARMPGMEDRAMGTMHVMDANMARHMRLTPKRMATPADSQRAERILTQLRTAIAKYQDPAAAVADGYKQFLPNVRNQKIYHFTNYRLAFLEAFRFNPAKPTSLLYQPQANGKLKLVGAMYTAPKRFSYDQLNDRIPLGMAQWHEHVNWCLPPKDQPQRWLDRNDGAPVFGPESPVATASECRKAGGEFHPLLFSWMVHVGIEPGENPWE